MAYTINKKFSVEFSQQEEFGFFDFYNNDPQIKKFAIDQKSFNVNLIGFEDINIKFFLIPLWRGCYNFKVKQSSYIPYVDDEDDINDSDSESLVKSKQWAKILILYAQFSIHSYVRLWVFRSKVVKSFRRWQFRFIQAKNLLYHNILEPQQFLPSDNFFNDFFEDSTIVYAKFIKHLDGFGSQSIYCLKLRSRIRKSFVRTFNRIVLTRRLIYKIMKKKNIPFTIRKRTKLAFFDKKQEALMYLQFLRNTQHRFNYLIFNWTVGSTIFIDRYLSYFRGRLQSFRNFVGSTRHNFRSFIFKFPFLLATFFDLKPNLFNRKNRSFAFSKSMLNGYMLDNKIRALNLLDYGKTFNYSKKIIARFENSSFLSYDGRGESLMQLAPYSKCGLRDDDHEFNEITIFSFSDFINYNTPWVAYFNRPTKSVANDNESTFETDFNEFYRRTIYR
ncbi:MAG TPA: hypothetical protein VIH86_05845 [Puia sp.]